MWKKVGRYVLDAVDKKVHIQLRILEKISAHHANVLRTSSKYNARTTTYVRSKVDIDDIHKNCNAMMCARDIKVKGHTFLPPLGCTHTFKFVRISSSLKSQGVRDMLI